MLNIDQVSQRESLQLVSLNIDQVSQGVPTVSRAKYRSGEWKGESLNIDRTSKFINSFILQENIEYYNS